MNCPDCGSAARKTITDGYYECLGVKTKEIPVYDRGPSGTPTMHVERHACGSRYQDGSVSTGLGMCDCNMAAIGVCVSCGHRKCGVHGGLFEDRFTCTTDVERIKNDRLVAQRLESKKRSEEVFRTAQASIARAKATLATETDPDLLIAGLLGVDQLPQPELARVWTILANSHRFAPNARLALLRKRLGSLVATRSEPVFVWMDKEADGDRYDVYIRHVLVAITADGRCYQGSATPELMSLFHPGLCLLPSHGRINIWAEPKHRWHDQTRWRMDGSSVHEVELNLTVLRSACDAQRADSLLDFKANRQK